MSVCICRASTKQWFTTGKMGRASSFDIKRSEGWYSIAGAATGQVSAVFGYDGHCYAGSALQPQSCAIARLCVHTMCRFSTSARPAALLARVRGLCSKDQMCTQLAVCCSDAGTVLVDAPVHAVQHDSMPYLQYMTFGNACAAVPFVLSCRYASTAR